MVQWKHDMYSTMCPQLENYNDNKFDGSPQIGIFLVLCKILGIDIIYKIKMGYCSSNDSDCILN